MADVEAMATTMRIYGTVRTRVVWRLIIAVAAAIASRGFMRNLIVFLFSKLDAIKTTCH